MNPVNEEHYFPEIVHGKLQSQSFSSINFPTFHSAFKTTVTEVGRMLVIVHVVKFAMEFPDCLIWNYRISFLNL